MFHRLSLFLLFPLIIFTVLGLRLFDLQIVHGQELFSISEENRFFAKRLVAPRGILYDRFLKPLVYNYPQYFHSVEPNRLYPVREHIAQDQALELLAYHPEQVFVEQYRKYAYPESLSGVVGYVGKVTKDDMDRDETLHPLQLVGKMGIERSLEVTLRGVDGVEKYETNALGQITRTLSTTAPRPGQDVVTTIDAELSEKVAQLMDGKKGTVIVGNPSNGQVFSMISVPSFNANDFTIPVVSDAEKKQRSEQILQYSRSDDQPLFQRVTSGQYPPGSVFKLVTALAGLDVRAFTKETTVVDEGVLKIDQYEFGNWFYRQYGRVEGAVNVQRAISRSNDIFFYKAAEWIGPERLAEEARLFGLGSRTGIQLPGEATGLVPDPSWKERVIGERWYLGNTYHFGIGQGDLQVTPMQIFQLTSALVNHGTMCTPQLIKDNGKDCKELGVSEENLQIVLQGMIDACSTGGTAFPFFKWNEERAEKVACKTGTAEFGGSDDRGYRKTHGWFTAVIPVERSKQWQDFSDSIVVTVLVESDEHELYREGSRDAAPIALEIAKWVEENR